MTPKQKLIEKITKRQMEYHEIAKHMDAETTQAYADGKIDGLDECLQFIKEILPNE